MTPQGNLENEPALFHPPMLRPAGNNSGNTSSLSTSSNNSNSSSSEGSPRNSNEDSPMDYLQPPTALQNEESLFSAYLHPPMALPEEPSKYSADHESTGTSTRSAIRNFNVLGSVFPVIVHRHRHRAPWSPASCSGGRSDIPFWSFISFMAVFGVFFFDHSFILLSHANDMDIIHIAWFLAAFPFFFFSFNRSSIAPTTLQSF